MKLLRVIGLCIALLLCCMYAALAQTSPNVTRVPVLDPRVHVLGRFQPQPDGSVRLGYPGTGIALRFEGASLALAVDSSSATSALTLIVDHGTPRLLLLDKGPQQQTLADHLPPGSHTVEVYKRTETWQGLVTLHALLLPDGEALLEPAPLPVRKLLFVGDSVTCGAGVDENATCTSDPLRPANDAYNAYGMVLGRRLDAQADLVCYGGRGIERDYRGLSIKDGVLNAPDFLDLAVATDEPATRASWDTQGWIPDAIVVSLGTNDFNLQKTKPLDADAFTHDLAALVRRLRAEYPNATIFVTEGAIVTDPLLRQYVRAAVLQLHDRHVAWAPATHYPGNGCNAHPTGEQHQQIADDLEPLLRHSLHW